MNKSNRLAVTLFLIAVFTLVALAGRQAPTTAAQNVLVTNSTAQAVPVKAATSFPVDVVNTANVHSFVTNTGSSPVPTTNALDKNPFEQIIHLSCADGVSSDSQGFQVANGKELVVEYVSVNAGCDIPNNFMTEFNVISQNSSAVRDGYTTFVGTAADSSGYLGFLNQQMALVVPPGHFLLVNGFRRSMTGLASAEVTIVGHYVSVP